MKALIKRYPINAKDKSQNEVWEETRWTRYMLETGDLTPYINEDYAYALCEDCPVLNEYVVDDFDVKEYTKKVDGKDVKYWLATFTGKAENTTTDNSAEIAELEARLAALKGL